MSLVVLTKMLIAPNPALIAASQTPAGAGPLTLTNAAGVALDTQRRVLITSAANISATSFLITGTKDTGQTISETLVGPNAGTAQSLYDYRTISSIVASGATAGALTVGTSSVGSSEWKNVNTRARMMSMSINASVVGTVAYSLEITNSRLLVSANNPQLAINVFPTSVANATSGSALNITSMIRAWRLTILSGTGTVTAEAEQSDI